MWAVFKSNIFCQNWLDVALEAPQKVGFLAHTTVTGNKRNFSIVDATIADFLL
jgi:hypothetical protein